MDKIKKIIISLLNKLPYIKTLHGLLKQYEEVTAYPPGHYYSPIPDVKEIENNKKRIFEKKMPEAININDAGQLIIFRELIPFYNNFPFNKNAKGIDRFRFQVPESFFTYTDAFVFYGISLLLKPKRIIEIGSGYSSALMLDINQYYFQGIQKLTFIDPDFTRLLILMKSGDETNSKLINQRVQEVEISVFLELEENDILFIDSSHVSKVGSDLNYLIFEVLPKLKKGVIVHFHDIYFPFEYSQDLVIKEKLAWNEAYLIKAFLMYNTTYEVCYFNNYMFELHNELIKENMPECLKDEGASLYLKKIN